MFVHTPNSVCDNNWISQKYRGFYKTWRKKLFISHLFWHERRSCCHVCFDWKLVVGLQACNRPICFWALATEEMRTKRKLCGTPVISVDRRNNGCCHSRQSAAYNARQLSAIILFQFALLPCLPRSWSHYPAGRSVTNQIILQSRTIVNLNTAKPIRNIDPVTFEEPQCFHIAKFSVWDVKSIG